MEIEIFLSKNVEQNAGAYFDRAKKLKKKIPGIVKTIEAQKNKLLTFEKQDTNKIEKAIKVKKEWYEKFRWFISSDGFLVVGGRDATSNEVVVKKHADNGDLVLHTDMAGSPFFVIKSNGKKIPESTIKEAADATCTFSRAWKLGLQTSDVFYVFPEQVSKKTKAGEYMGKGAFMVYGKSNYVENKINLAVGISKEKAIM